MRVKYLNTVFILALTAVSAAQVAAPQNVAHRYRPLPWSFEENHGQTNPKVKFLSRAKGYTAFLTSKGFVLGLHPARTAKSGASSQRGEKTQSRTTLELTLIDSAENPKVVGENPQTAKVNYFIGNDPGKWVRNVPTYGRIRYKNVYPGIDLIYYGNRRQLEYDFAISPHADPNSIEFEIKGARQISVDQTGNLVLTIGTEELRLLRPGVYQEMNGHRQPLQAQYVIRGGSRVGFQVAKFNRARPLVIDPTLLFSSYLGGSGDDIPSGIAADSNGNVYLCGYTDSADFPGATMGSFPAGSDHVFVAKLDASGSNLIYADYIGGNSQDYGYALALDSANEVYVTGSTASSDFPTINPYQGIYPGSFNAFLTKLSSDGSQLLYSTYLGGNGSDVPSKVAIDSASNVLLAGTTSSTNFPVLNAYQSTASPNQGGLYGTYGFLTKFSPDGSSLAFSTYLGGSSNDPLNCGGTQCWIPPTTTLNGMTLDASGNAYLAGITNTNDFPTTSGAYLTANSTTQNSTVGFLSKISSVGALRYSTYFYETTGFTDLTAVAVDTTGSAYVTGYAYSNGTFPITTTSICDPNDSTISCDFGFVTKVDPTGSTLSYSTFLGPNNIALPEAIVLDGNNNAYVLATTSSDSFVPVNGLEPFAGETDLLIDEIDAAANSQVFATYFGGSGEDDASAMAIDSYGNLYVTGSTDSTDVPTTQQALQASAGGNTDGLVIKIATVPLPLFAATPTSLSFASAPVGATSSVQQVTVQNMGAIAMHVSSVSTTGDFAQTNNCITVAPAGSCSISVTFTPTASGTRAGVLTVNDDAQGAPHTIALSGSGMAIVASVALTPSSLAFSEVVLGRTSAAQIATLTNVGAASVTISSVQVTGDFSQTNNCQGPLAVGSSCTLNVSFTPTATGSRTGVLTVNDSATGSPHTVQLSGSGMDFGLTGSPQSTTVNRGANAVFTVTATPLGGTFSNQIQFTCSGPPTGSTCSASPASVTPGLAAASVSVTVTTFSASSQAPVLASNGFPPHSYTVLLGGFTLSLIFLGFAGRKRKALAMFAIVPGLLMLVSCAGGTGIVSSGPKGTGTTPGNYAITVTGTSGSLTHTTQFTLTVQ